MMHFDKDGPLSWEDYQKLRSSFLELLLDDISAHLQRGAYAEVNKFLRVAPVADSDPKILVEILRTTLSFSTHLPDRPSFKAAARCELLKVNSTDITDTILEDL